MAELVIKKELVIVSFVVLLSLVGIGLANAKWSDRVSIGAYHLADELRTRFQGQDYDLQELFDSGSLTGPKGPQGDLGVNGTKGLTGDKGDKGDTGRTVTTSSSCVNGGSSGGSCNCNPLGGQVSKIKTPCTVTSQSGSCSAVNGKDSFGRTTYGSCCVCASYS